MPTTETTARPTSEAAVRASLGHGLRNLRLKYGLTQAELSQGLPDVKPAMISAIECASRNVALDTARAVYDLAQSFVKTRDPVPAPAEVDPEAVRQAPTIENVSRLYRTYVERNHLTGKQQSLVFSLSNGHLARIRRGHGSVSPATLTKILDIIRDNPTGVVSATHTPRGYVRRASGVSAAQGTPTPAPTVPPTATQAPSERLATVIGPNQSIAAALTFDGVTPHYFVKTQDGQVIVLRPRT